MILLTILSIIAVLLVLFVIFSIVIGGATFVIIFADVIVCVVIIAMVIKWLMNRR